RGAAPPEGAGPSHRTDRATPRLAASKRDHRAAGAAPASGGRSSSRTDVWPRRACEPVLDERAPAPMLLVDLQPRVTDDLRPADEPPAFGGAQVDAFHLGRPKPRAPHKPQEVALAERAFAEERRDVETQVSSEAVTAATRPEALGTSIEDVERQVP